MDDKGLLFLTATITVIDISKSRDIASIAMKAVEKKKVIDKSSVVTTKSHNDEHSESSEEDERGGIELLDTFKHFVKALDVNKV